MMLKLAAIIAVILWLPMMLQAEPVEQAAPTEPIVLPVPPGVYLNATNPQMYRDRNGVIFAATRADSSIGGLVWRVDGYVDADHPGIATYVLNDPNNPQPETFHANGELQLWPDGYLWYVTVTIQDLDHRDALTQTAHPVPGWTP